jgi:hypothetical protein
LIAEVRFALGRRAKKGVIITKPKTKGKKTGNEMGNKETEGKVIGLGGLI